MDFNKLVNKRYSTRAYKNTPVEDEKLLQILNAARIAPTASNRQPFQIIVIHTNGREDDLLTIYPRNWFVQAPLVLCICGQPSFAWTRKDGKCYLDVDCAIVMDYMISAATELGLGSCFIAAFDIENARRVLEVPGDVEPILFTPLGYPNDVAKVKERKSLQDLIRYEHW
jgi:nitroreductase